MGRKLIKMCAVSLAAVAILAGCGGNNGKALEDIQKGNQKLGISVHDPSIVKAEDNYYIFGSHMEAAESSDLLSWKSFASGVNKKNPLFDNLFSEDMKAFEYVGKYTDGGYAVWAPDVIYNKAMNKWVMYFSTSHDYRTSNICFATADKVTGPYTYQDTILYSGFTSMTAEKTNFIEIMGEDAKVRDYLTAAQYNNLKYPNCIDPTLFYDKEGRMWMVYGSWSGGIWLLEIDETTGYPIHPETNEETHTDKYFGKYLIGGIHNSCEGPYILYDEESDYYYLFISYGELTREGGYQIRQFRSENVEGPYLDATGNTLGYESNHSAFGVKMMGNYLLPSLETAYMAPGHNSALIDGNGKRYLVYHQRFDSGTEYHEPRIHQMFINEDGWMVAAPFATGDEELKADGYQSKSEIAGTYYSVNHGTDIGSEIHSYQRMELKKDGQVIMDGKKVGTYSITEGKCFITLVIEDITYKGIVIEMKDEAGNFTRCFSVVGNNNETIWGVHYIE